MPVPLDECEEGGDMSWVVPLYGRDKVNQAARRLASNEVLPVAEFDRCMAIVNNWRSSHSYPLNTFQVTLRKYARGIDPDALIAQRIKRYSSIESKLLRLPNMKLTQMQDIGGGRAVVRTIGMVRELVELYDKSSIKHARASTDDYLLNPKPTGYRGVHLVYRYLSDKNKTEYNGLKIELQLRSQYQHAWATAVETVGTFVQQALKSSVGDKQWLRFFALMGSAIAMRERCPIVSGTPNNRADLIQELGALARNLNVEQRLSAYGTALRTLRADPPNLAKAHYYLLVLDPVANELKIQGFRISELELAAREYAAAEALVKRNSNMDAVLVSVDSVSALERAYPNYFADTRMFLQLLKQALTGKPARVAVSARVEAP